MSKLFSFCSNSKKVETLNPEWHLNSWTFQGPELGQRDTERHLWAVKIESTKESLPKLASYT